MRMPLTAVADDGDFLSLDQVQVGVAIVVNTHGSLTPTPRAPRPFRFVLVLLGGLAGGNKPPVYPLQRPPGAENSGMISRAKRRSCSLALPAIVSSRYSAPAFWRAWSLAQISSGVP